MFKVEEIFFYLNNERQQTATLFNLWPEVIFIIRMQKGLLTTIIKSCSICHNGGRDVHCWLVYYSQCYFLVNFYEEF